MLFARKPELAKVKTRLAATLGDEKALAIYRRLLEHTRSVASDVDCCDVHVFLTDQSEDSFWTAFNTHEQVGVDLGEKMLHAFTLVFKLGYEKAVIIGSDCPKLGAAHVLKAFEALKDHDFVFGPALDGGYYLMGMKQVLSALFAEISWSTDSVLTDSQNRVAKAHKTHVLLEVLNDLDESADIPEDWC